MNARDREEVLTLEILEAIDEQSDVSQRHLARRMGVALGLANSYLKRCVRKGLVKIQHAPANRYLYYLTPRGFAEKSRLTAQYLSYSFEFYRRAGQSCNQAFRICQQRGLRRIMLCGVSELAELASLRALEHEVKIVGVYDRQYGRKQFLNTSVFVSLGDCVSFDACLLTDLSDPQITLKHLKQSLRSEQIVVPSILGLPATV